MRWCVLALALFATTVFGRGVSPYLPVDISPEIERKIERVLILGEQPTLKRPFAAAAVLDALPRACERDPALCQDVQRYLLSLTRTAGISYASVSVAGHSGPATPLPNRHGMDTQSAYEVGAAVYWQAGDHFAFTGGVLAYDGATTPTGSIASVGRDYVQLDIGYRDRSWSPFEGSAMLISTQATTMPSITLSNYTALTRWKVRYEVFLAEMSESSNIVFEDRTTTGHPRLFGVHASIEPLPGWSLGVSRVMQYGGGERDDSFSSLAEAFFNPADNDNLGATSSDEFGNQVAALTSKFVLADPLPLAVYFEYAGEDTSTLSNLRLGNSALSAGIAFPKIWRDLSLTVEITEWQNSWYVHHIYQDGLRHENSVIGHWGGDWRLLNDGVGASSVFARFGWQPKFGGAFETSYRQLQNDDYTGGDYESAHHVEARYSRPWEQFSVGAELMLGRDVFGDSYSRLSAFLRF